MFRTQGVISMSRGKRCGIAFAFLFVGFGGDHGYLGQLECSRLDSGAYSTTEFQRSVADMSWSTRGGSAIQEGPIPGRLGLWSAFASPSPLVKHWLQLDSREKEEVLGVVIESADPRWLVVFLAELVYAGIAWESDPVVADRMRAAVMATAVSHASTSVFLLEHIEQACPHDSVRERAGRNAAALRRRIHALGF